MRIAWRHRAPSQHLRLVLQLPPYCKSATKSVTSLDLYSGSPTSGAPPSFLDPEGSPSTRATPQSLEPPNESYPSLTRCSRASGRRPKRPRNFGRLFQQVIIRVRYSATKSTNRQLHPQPAALRVYHCRTWNNPALLPVVSLGSHQTEATDSRLIAASAYEPRHV